MFTYSSQTRPVATATPTGDFKAARGYRWFSEAELADIEFARRCHLVAQIEEFHCREQAELRKEEERRRIEALPYQGSGRHPMTVSSRQAVIAEEGTLVRRYNRETDKSRSHSRAKARLRDRRTIRQLALAM